MLWLRYSNGLTIVKGNLANGSVQDSHVLLDEESDKAYWHIFDPSSSVSSQDIGILIDILVIDRQTLFYFLLYYS